MTIGKTIARLRKATQITVRELAALSGISATSISQIENGHTDISLRCFQIISKVFRTTPEMITLCSIQLNTWPKQQAQEFRNSFPAFTDQVFNMITESLPINGKDAKFTALVQSKVKALDRKPAMKRVIKA
jgi:transcriptional regulator with XRE-family HTH domain